jgi:hypothetical protein
MMQALEEGYLPRSNLIGWIAMGIYGKLIEIGVDVHRCLDHAMMICSSREGECSSPRALQPAGFYTTPHAM